MKLAQKLAIKYIKARLRMTAMLSKEKAARKALKLFSTPRKRAKIKTTALFAKGEKLSFKLGKQNIRGHRWSPNGSPRKRILILHGFESTYKKFGGYIEAFIKKGYEVLAFDAPAHGASDGKQINLPLYADMIASINTRYGPIQSFMGHSFGGLALTHFLETNKLPENAKAVLIAPATETQTAVDMFFEYLDLDDEVRLEFDSLILKKTGHLPAYFSARRAVGNISIPLLWLHDEEDEITPIQDAIKVQQDQHPNIQFIFTKDLGHRKIYRDEEVIKKIIEFL